MSDIREIVAWFNEAGQFGLFFIIVGALTIAWALSKYRGKDEN